MKIALAFWGLTRSLKYTIESINEKILNILKKHNIEYKIFMHTWTVNSVYNNTRSKEANIKLDNEEYKLLSPVAPPVIPSLVVSARFPFNAMQA